MASIMPPIPRYFFLYGEPCLMSVMHPNHSSQHYN